MLLKIRIKTSSLKALSLSERQFSYSKSNTFSLSVVVAGCVRSKVLPEPFSAYVWASLACVMVRIVLNDVLCYLASARSSFPRDVNMKSAVTFTLGMR